MKFTKQDFWLAIVFGFVYCIITLILVTVVLVYGGINIDGPPLVGLKKNMVGFFSFIMDLLLKPLSFIPNNIHSIPFIDWVFIFSIGFILGLIFISIKKIIKK